MQPQTFKTFIRRSRAKDLAWNFILVVVDDEDSPIARDLLDDLGEGEILLADRAYDTDALRNFADERKARANMASVPAGCVF